MSAFWASIVALFCWSGSDTFSKLGTRNEDKSSQWKVSVAVGGIMGIHALWMILARDIPFSLYDMWIYLPASLLYITSMILGYIGLRYIELSISSPICNSSGAVALIMSLIYFGVTFVPDEDSDRIFLNLPIILGVIAIVAGVVSLGFVEHFEDEGARVERQKTSNRKYAKSFLAILFPILYCVLDSLGTFVDTMIADNYLVTLAERYPDLSEEKLDLLCGDILNTAYEFTWLAMAVGCLIYLLLKREKPQAKYDVPKLLGGVCETAGQIFYMMVVVSDFKPGLVIISAYCALSVLWSRVFLKEKLSLEHYLSIAAVLAGIVVLGFYDV